MRESRRELGAGLYFGVAFAALLGLHGLAPELSISWSYGRPRWLLLSVLLVVTLPVALARLWRTDALDAWLARLPRIRPIALWSILLLVLIALWLLAAAPPLSPDTRFLIKAVNEGTRAAPRWLLLLATYQGAHRWLGDWLRPYEVVQVVNVLLASAALAALAACAHRLGERREEQLAIGALVFGAFGVLQISLAYPDVYPAPLAVTALYCWLGLAAIDGERHPFWPLAIAAIGPFVYLGASILAPSLLAVVAAELRRDGGVKRIGWSVLGAVFLAGLATWPFYGWPFAWIPMLEAVTALRSAEMGLNSSGYQMPVGEILAPRHLWSVTHVLLLVDPVGWVLMLGPGSWLALGRVEIRVRRRLIFLALIVLAYLAYCLAMDPLYGAYLDWDLFSYGAVASSLLGAYALVVWGRGRSAPLVGAALGLALALNLVHLAARLNAMPEHRARHVHESPPHLSVPPAPRSFGPDGAVPSRE
jgi:hypothetical protein